jgi:hypothetical protein
MKNLGDAQLIDDNACGLSFFTSRCFLILVILNVRSNSIANRFSSLMGTLTPA